MKLLEIKGEKPLIQAYRASNTSQLNNLIANQTSVLQDKRAIGVLKANALSFGSQVYKLEQVFDVPYYDKGYIYKLKNDQKVVVIPKPGPLLINTVAKVGGLNESEHLNGISHFLEHTLFKASRNLPPGEYNKQVELIGGRTNAETANGTTAYSILAGNHKNIEKFMELHAEMVQYPTFPSDEINEEKDTITEEINEDLDNIYDVAKNNILIPGLFGINTDNDLILGSKDNIQSFTPEDLQDFHKKYYDPSNLTTFIVGDIKPEKAVQLAAKYFDKSSSGKPQDIYKRPLNPIQKAKFERIKNPYSDTPDLFIGFVGPKNNDLKEIVAIEALFKYLAGYRNCKLTRALKQLNTDACINNTFFSSEGNNRQALILSCPLDNGDEKKGFNIIKKVLKDAAKTPPTKKEMKIIKYHMLDDINLGSERSETLGNMVENAVLDHNNLEFITKQETAIKALKPSDIQNIAKKYLRMDKASVILLQPDGTRPIRKSELSFRGHSRVNTADPSAEKYIGKLTETELANNVLLVTNNNKDVIRNSLSFSLHVDNDEISKPGVIEILDHMLNTGNGAKSEEELNDILDEKCIISEIGLSDNIINLGLSVRTKDSLLQGFELGLESIFNPDLSAENFRQAKREITFDYKQLPKTPDARTYEILFHDTPIRNTARVVKNEINKVTLSDVRKLYKKLVKNAGIKVVTTANFDKQPGLKEGIIKILDQIPEVKKYNPPKINYGKKLEKTRVILEREKEVKQAEILQLFKIDEADSVKDHVALEALGIILGEGLGSLLFKDLREKQGLAYSVGAGYTMQNNSNTFELSINTTTETKQKNKPTKVNYDNIDKSLKGFNKHLQSLIKEKVTPEQLEYAKNLLINNFVLDTETSNGKNKLIEHGYEEIHGKDFTKEYYETINSLTADDLQKAAKKHLDKPSVISILAGNATVNAAKDRLKEFGEVKVY